MVINQYISLYSAQAFGSQFDLPRDFSSTYDLSPAQLCSSINPCVCRHFTQAAESPLGNRQVEDQCTHAQPHLTSTGCARRRHISRGHEPAGLRLPQPAGEHTNALHRPYERPVVHHLRVPRRRRLCAGLRAISLEGEDEPQPQPLPDASGRTAPRGCDPRHRKIESRNRTNARRVAPAPARPSGRAEARQPGSGGTTCQALRKRASGLDRDAGSL